MQEVSFSRTETETFLRSWTLATRPEVLFAMYHLVKKRDLNCRVWNLDGGRGQSDPGTEVVGGITL